MRMLIQTHSTAELESMLASQKAAAASIAPAHDNAPAAALTSHSTFSATAAADAQSSMSTVFYDARSQSGIAPPSLVQTEVGRFTEVDFSSFAPVSSAPSLQPPIAAITAMSEPVVDHTLLDILYPGWPRDLPSPDLVARLIDVYFTKSHMASGEQDRYRQRELTSLRMRP